MPAAYNVKKVEPKAQIPMSININSHTSTHEVNRHRHMRTKQIRYYHDHTPHTFNSLTGSLHEQDPSPPVMVLVGTT